MASPNGMAQLPRVKPGRPNALRQVVDLQNKVFNAAQVACEKPRELTLLTRAWCELEERKRILRGRPLPGMLKPVAKTRTKHVNNKPLESLPDPTPVRTEQSMLKQSIVGPEGSPLSAPGIPLE